MPRVAGQDGHVDETGVGQSASHFLILGSASEKLAAELEPPDRGVFHLGRYLKPSMVPKLVLPGETKGLSKFDHCLFLISQGVRSSFAALS